MNWNFSSSKGGDLNSYIRETAGEYGSTVDNKQGLNNYAEPILSLLKNCKNGMKTICFIHLYCQFLICNYIYNNLYNYLIK